MKRIYALLLPVLLFGCNEFKKHNGKYVYIHHRGSSKTVYTVKIKEKSSFIREKHTCFTVNPEFKEKKCRKTIPCKLIRKVDTLFLFPLTPFSGSTTFYFLDDRKVLYGSITDSSLFKHHFAIAFKR